MRESTPGMPTMPDMLLPESLIKYYRSAAEALNQKEFNDGLYAIEVCYVQAGDEVPIHVSGSWRARGDPAMSALHREAETLMANGVHEPRLLFGSERRDWPPRRMNCPVDEVAWDGTANSVCWCCGKRGEGGPLPSIPDST